MHAKHQHDDGAAGASAPPGREVVSSDVLTGVPSAEEETQNQPRRRRPVRRALIALGVLALVLAMVVGGGLWFVTARYAGNVDQIKDVFAGVDKSSRPGPATSAGDAATADPVTFLLVGSDTRGHLANGEDPDGRSDAIMIARLSGDRKHLS